MKHLATNHGRRFCGPVSEISRTTEGDQRGTLNKDQCGGFSEKKHICGINSNIQDLICALTNYSGSRMDRCG